MGLLLTNIQTPGKKKLFSVFPYFSLFLLSDLILSDRSDKNIDFLQLQNKLHVPAKDKLDISGQFRVMSRTNLLHTRTYTHAHTHAHTHTHTHIHIHRHIHTYTQTFSREPIFRLRELKNIKNYRNLGVEKFHRTKLSL